MKLRRRIGSVFLAFAMALSLIPSVAVSALAAPNQKNLDLIEFTYEHESDGGPGNPNNKPVTVNVYVDSATTPAQTISANNADTYHNYMSVAVKTGVEYDIDHVSFSGTVTEEWINHDLKSYSFRHSWADDLINPDTLVVSVYLRTVQEKPAIDGEVYSDRTLNVSLRVYESQLLKMLHLSETSVEVTPTTEIEDIQYVFYHGIDDAAIDENHIDRENDYWEVSALQNWNGWAVPYNVKELNITYRDNASGNEKEVIIPAGDLRFVRTNIGGQPAYEVEAEDQSTHIVYFYNETDGHSGNNYFPYAIRFVNNGESLGDQMPVDPTYQDSKYKFVNWEQNDWDGDGMPFLSTTIINDDVTVFARKISSEHGGTIIQISNENNSLFDRVAELFNEDKQDDLTLTGSNINKDSVAIVVRDANGNATEKNGDGDRWMYLDEDWYLVNSTYGSDHINFTTIKEIDVYFKVSGEEEEYKVTIPVGEYPGDLSVRMTAAETTVDLVVNSPNDVQARPEEPDPEPEPEYTITGIDKELVEKEDDLPAGVTQEDGPFMFPNDEGVVVISVGKLGTISNVTLLYKITVTGESGAAFTVTDIGATLVQADGSAAVTQGANDEGFATFSGAIPEGGEAVFYVSKTFSADEITDEGKLVNTAKITSENVDPDGEDEDTEEVDAKEETNTIYAYVQFIGSGAEGALTEEEQEYVTDTFGCTLHGNNNDYVAIGSFDWNIPDPSGSEYAPEEGAYANDKNFFDSLLGDSFVFPEDYTQHEDAGNNFPVDKVDWNKLTTAKGAGQFDKVGVDTVCWHLDGQIQLYAPDISVDKELTKVVRDGNEVPNISTDTVLEVGDVLTWTITVTNSGNADAEGLKLSDTLVAEAEDGTTTDRTANVTAVTDGASVDDFDVPAASNGANGEVEFTATYTVTADDKGLTLKNTATVSDEDGEVPDDGEDSTENPVAERKVSIEKKLTSAKRGENATTDNLDNYKAQVGDVLSYTITVTNEGNTELTDVKVTDSMWVGTQYAIKVDGAENYAGADGFTIKNGIAAGGSVTITYTYIVQDSDVAAGEIKNTAGVYLPDGDEPGEEPDDTDEVIVNMDEDAYTITITPADIVIYTGGDGYAGVTTNEEGVLLENPTVSGLPEPGYHIDLPDAVETWLKEQGVDMSVAADLANYLHFRYYDANGEMTRNWDLEDQGVYSMEGDTVTAYVYSLSTNTVEGEFKDTPVRLEFTNNGEIVTDDIVKMDENTASATYQMTIYDGGLDQSQIKAVFTAKDSEGNEKSITCNVTIDTGDLTVKSVADENPDTNAIAANGDAVADGTLAAVDNGTVDYYVNDSEVKIENDADRVQLLVDSVSNEPSFNEQMETDAISEVREDGISLSDAQAESYYLDLVDTENGNAVVTMGDDDELTIYWPMPDDADPNGDFYIVHYDEMDRATATTTPQSDPDILTVSKDGNHLTFATSSFSPFVLVYEQKDSGGPVTPPVEDDDDDTPPPVNPNPPQLNTEDHYAYIVGYADGTVRPEGDITRAEVATIFFRLLTDESRNEYWSQTNDYTDVAEGDWYNNAVSTLSKAGILNGYEDGSFQPNGNITRAEFATIAARFFEATYEGEDLFPDIKGHWARDYINQAAHAGIVNGYEDGTFRPQDNITRAEAMTIVNRTLDRHPDADHFLDNMVTWPDNLESAWYYEQVQEATNSHEYIMKTDADKNPYEIWKEILPVRDWSELENTWSEAHAG